MIEDVYAIMKRIQEIRSLVGMKRHNPITPAPLAKDQGPSEYAKMQDAAIAQVKGKYADKPEFQIPNEPKAEDLNKVVDYFSDKNRVPSGLVKAVIQAESGYNTEAVSKKGALGLMQLMPAVADSLGVKDPFNSEENIRGGVELLGGLLKDYNGDYKEALAAYNAGKRGLDEKGMPKYRETQEYIQKVISSYLSNKLD